MPTLNGLFVLALPHGYRARAFAVVQGLLQLSQGAAVLVTGIIGEHVRVPVVVGLWSAGGTLLMFVLAARFPGAGAFDREIAAAAATMPESADEPDNQTYHPRHARRTPPMNRAPAVGRARPQNGSHVPDAPWPQQPTRITPDHG
jgi:hypothetical protein